MPKVEGLIGYFGLTAWWLSEFTPAERECIESKYRSSGIGIDPASGSRVVYQREPLTQGRIEYTDETATGLLTGLSGWFRGPEDRHIARRLLDKAENLMPTNVLDQHFTYQVMIETYYKDRDRDPTALATAITACEGQISIAPQAARAFKREYRNHPLPTHVGFRQLAVIREKQKDYTEAIRLSKLAKEQGWAGDWDKRITRCERSVSK